MRTPRDQIRPRAIKEVKGKIADRRRRLSANPQHATKEQIELEKERDELISMFRGAERQGMPKPKAMKSAKAVLQTASSSGEDEGWKPVSTTLDCRPVAAGAAEASARTRSAPTEHHYCLRRGWSRVG